MKSLLLAAIVGLLTFGPAYGNLHYGKKGVIHLAAVPFIAGTGIYSDVRMLQTAHETSTKAAAITNLSLLGLQATLGTTIFFGNDQQPPVIRVIHRIIGASVLASAIWISVAATRDNGVPTAARGTAYAHTVLAAAPLILFTF